MDSKRMKLKAEGKKYCKHCDTVKTFDEFTKLHGKIRSQCSECTRKSNTAYYSRNKKVEKYNCEICSMSVYEKNKLRHENGNLHKKNAMNKIN